MTWLFWTMLAVVAYAYAGFPLLLWLRAAVLRRCWQEDPQLTPRLSVVIAAYNEERNIGQRLDNLLSLDYPAAQREIIVGSDGSDDRTDEIVADYADRGVRLVAMPRQGKGATVSGAVAAAEGDILVFSDANTEFASDALRCLARPFADPDVGGVAGNQVYLRGKRSSTTADGERLYWNYDQRLKDWQSQGGSVTSATGAVYAIRSNLFEPVPAGAMDDFFISTGVIRQGKRLIYSQAARAYEPVAEAEGVEFSRKQRVIMQGLQAVLCRRELLNPFRYGFYAWQLFSHKVLRRLVGIPLLILAITCPWLWNQGPLYQALVIAEGAVIAPALIALLLRRTRLGRWKPLALISYFLMVNTAALAAVTCLIWGRRVYRWEPERHQGDRDPAAKRAETLT